MKKRRPRQPGFTCPICLTKKQAIAVAPDGGGDDRPTEMVDEDGDRVFELTACGHRFCASCLRDYVRSKLLDGNIDIQCCHHRGSEVDDYLSCRTFMDEAEVSRLVRTGLCGRMSRTEAGHRLPFGSAEDGGRGEADDADGAALWAKYQKLKFDKFYGKDAVRRCPTCDEPRLFDVRSMKEYRFKFLSQNNGVCTPAPAKTDGNASAGRMGRLSRFLNVFKGYSETALGAVEEDTGSSDTNPEEGRGDGVRGSLPEEDGPNNPNPEGGVDDIEKNTPPKEDGDSSEGEKLTQPLTIKAHSLHIKAGASDPTSSAAEKSESTLDIICNVEDRASGGESAEERKIPETISGENSGESVDEGKMPETGDGVSQSAASEIPSNTQDRVSNGNSAEEAKTFQTHDNLARGFFQAASLQKSTTPVVTCHSCNTEFCYFHSNAHSGKSCVEYHLRSAERERSSVEYAAGVLRAKPCPSCGIPVVKDGGCNLMRCHTCDTNFCWLCGKAVDNGYDHFPWWRLGGCANVELEEEHERWRCIRWGARLVSFLQIVVLGPLALALSLVSILLCPFPLSGCGTQRLVDTVCFWGTFLSFMLFFPFMVLGVMLLPLYPLYCFLLAAGAFFAKMFRALSAQGRTARPQSAQGGTPRPQPAQGGTPSGPDDAAPAAEGGSNSASEVEMANLGHATATPDEDLVRKQDNILDRV